MTKLDPSAPPLTQRFADRMGALLGPDFPSSLGLAVSGGGDSMAMLHLAAGWARVYGIALRVVTVDHGLRPESAAEAALVADEAAGLGLSHDVLTWDGASGGNVMDAARRARLDLIGAWAGRTRDVLMAHTEDDVAETFLMRLRRGAAADGLAAMAAVREVPRGGFESPWRILRPLLGESRAALRHYADTLRIPYVDDPTNEDRAFDRARMRQLLRALESEGLGQTALAQAATRLGEARVALHARAADAAANLVIRPANPLLWRGDIALDRDGFAAVERDTQLRLMRNALQFITSADYAPRGPSLDAALDRVLGGGAVTLHGAQIVPKGDKILIFREYSAVQEQTADACSGAIWDRRWVLSDAPGGRLTLRALGPDGLHQAAPEDRGGLPAAALHARPALWKGDRLVACAALGYGLAYDITLRPLHGDFVPTPGI